MHFVLCVGSFESIHYTNPYSFGIKKNFIYLFHNKLYCCFFFSIELNQNLEDHLYCINLLNVCLCLCGLKYLRQIIDVGQICRYRPLFVSENTRLANLFDRNRLTFSFVPFSISYSWKYQKFNNIAFLCSSFRTLILSWLLVKQSRHTTCVPCWQIWACGISTFLGVCLCNWARTL